jgi:hypothetical protein
MIHDSAEFIQIATSILRQCEVLPKTLLSKIYVNLLMAVESDLKSIIISLSTNDTDAFEAYKKARKFSHHNKSMYDEIKKLGKNKLKLLSKKDEKKFKEFISRFKVYNRYGLEVIGSLLMNVESEEFYNSKSMRDKLNEKEVIVFISLVKKLHKIAIKSSDRLPEILLEGKIAGEYFSKRQEVIQQIKDYN